MKHWVRFGSRFEGVRVPHYAAFLFLGMAITAAGCSDRGRPSLTAPSSVGPSLESSARTGPTVRYYKVAAAPASVAASSSVSLSVTFTNCDETACPGSSTSSNGNHSIGSAEIILPAGFTATSVTTVTGSKAWGGAIVGNTIRLGATNGTQKLALGESITVTFSAYSAATCGNYTFTTGAYQDTLSSGALVKDTPFSRVGPQPQVAVTGCEGGNAASGCGHGYWKNHPGAWQNYSPADTLGSAFSGLAGHGLADVTFDAALSFGGGPTVTEAVQILLRTAVASLLNAVHPGVDFPLTQAQLVTDVNSAIATGNRSVILNLNADLDALNNLGCPLN